MTDALRVEGLVKRYGDFAAVDGVSFTLREGEVLGLLGANGAGKSTLIKVLCNLALPTAGQAWLAGEPLLGTHSAAHRRSLGALVEAPRFHPQLSGRRNLSLLARLHGVPASRVEEVLDAVGLTERAGERFDRFSMGMKQRLGLAAVFLHHPRVIILDEPTGGLDPVGRAQIHDLIETLMLRYPASILLCSHDFDEVKRLCHRALVMERGRVILDQSLREPGGMAAVQRVFLDLAAALAARREIA
jgi:ABC-2 type transport system ATP-binding protein